MACVFACAYILKSAVSLGDCMEKSFLDTFTSVICYCLLPSALIELKGQIHTTVLRTKTKADSLQVFQHDASNLHSHLIIFNFITNILECKFFAAIKMGSYLL